MAKHTFPRKFLSVEVLEDRCLMSATVLAPLAAPIRPEPPPSGQIKIDAASSTGGTFDADISVKPKLTFTPPVKVTPEQAKRLGAEWIDVNGDRKMGAAEFFMPVGGKLAHLGNSPAPGSSKPGAIRWIDVNLDGTRQGNETFLFLKGGDLQRVGVGGNGHSSRANVFPWVVAGDPGRADIVWYGGNSPIPAGPAQNGGFNGFEFVHGGFASAPKTVCNGNTTTTTSRFNDGTTEVVNETKEKGGWVIGTTTTTWNPNGSVTKTTTQEGPKRDGSRTTTTTTWNAGGEGGTIVEDTTGGYLTEPKKFSAGYDDKGRKFTQTDENGTNTKDEKTGNWDTANGNKPSDKVAPKKMPPKPAKPK